MLKVVSSEDSVKEFQHNLDLLKETEEPYSSMKAAGLLATPVTVTDHKFI